MWPTPSVNPAEPASIERFLKRRSDLTGAIQLEGVREPIHIAPELLRATAAKFLFAVQEGGEGLPQDRGVEG